MDLDGSNVTHDVSGRSSLDMNWKFPAPSLQPAFHLSHLIRLEPPEVTGAERRLPRCRM